MKHGHPLEVLFHKLICLGEAAYQVVVPFLLVDNNCHVDVVVACIAYQIHNPHVHLPHLVEDHEEDPKAEVAYAPWGYLGLASEQRLAHSW